MPISEFENNLNSAKWKGLFVPALRKVKPSVPKGGGSQCVTVQPFWRLIYAFDKV